MIRGGSKKGFRIPGAWRLMEVRGYHCGMPDIDGWMDGWRDGWMDGWRDGEMDGWMDGQMDRWMDGWVDHVWMSGWMGGWMDR